MQFSTVTQMRSSLENTFQITYHCRSTYPIYTRSIERARIAVVRYFLQITTQKKCIADICKSNTFFGLRKI